MTITILSILSIRNTSNHSISFTIQKDGTQILYECDKKDRWMASNHSYSIYYIDQQDIFQISDMFDTAVMT